MVQGGVNQQVERMGNRLWLPMAGAVALLLATGLVWRLAGRDSVSLPVTSSRQGPSPNIILISVDTLRADHLSTYGYFRQTSPNLDQLAPDSIVFDKAFTVMSTTLPAHISLVTGIHPAKHNVLSNGWKFNGPFPTLAERLKQAGYSTGGFITGFPLTAESGMGRGFDVYRDTGRQGRRPTPKIPGTLANQRATEWLEQHRQGPVFLFIHYFDVHPPYMTPSSPAPPFGMDEPLAAHMISMRVSGVGMDSISPAEIQLDERPIGDLLTAINAYDNQVHHVDAMIADLLHTLEQLGLLDDALVIITADHGEGLGQHGLYSHGLHLYEEQLRIPLIVRYFGSNWTGRRITSAVSLLDVVPTVLELLELPSDPELHGRSLLASMKRQGDTPANRWLLAQRREYSDWVLQKRGRFASKLSLHVLRGDHRLKYLLAGDGTEELYDLEADPLELNNLGNAQLEACSRLRPMLEETLDDYLTDVADAEERLDEETRRALEALGYLP